MDKLIANFSKQLQEAIEIGNNANLTKHREIKNVLVSGLGGSGIGGNIAADLSRKTAAIPFLVNKEYSLPAFVNENTLVIISSYSGNTEETVQSLNEALNKGSKIICVTSGGKILDTAKEKELDHIVIPGGMPPRACLGYSLVQQLFILNFYGLISGNFKDELKKAIQLIDNQEQSIRERASEIAGKLSNKIPVIYAASNFESVAVRFRQQINENSKMLCWHHVVPEMNHNELVGWRDKNDDLAVVIFRNDNDFERVQKRIEINKEIISNYTANILEIYSQGTSDIEKTIYLIHLGDWISFYMADIRNMDAVEVKVIDYLKGELAKV